MTRNWESKPPPKKKKNNTRQSSLPAKKPFRPLDGNSSGHKTQAPLGKTLGFPEVHNFNLTPCLPPGCKGAGPQGSKGAALAPKWPKPKPKWLLSHSLSLTRLEGEPPQGTPAGTSSTGLGGQFWPPGRMGLVWAAAGVGHLHPRSQVHWYVRVGSLSSSTRSKGEPTSDNSPSRARARPACLSSV